MKVKTTFEKADEDEPGDEGLVVGWGSVGDAVGVPLL